jgi:hypothetical protein
MSDSYIHELTIEYLMNKEIYEKHKQQEVEKGKTLKEAKFYKKRFLQLTRDMANKTYPDDLLLDVHQAYQQYVKTCVYYFKIIDKRDMIQEDYNDLDLTKETLPADIKRENLDHLVFRTVQTSKPSLDTFVIKKNAPQENPIVLPKKKVFHLKDPQLKLKGLKDKEIGKKNNMDSIYENPPKDNEKNEKDKNTGKNKKSKDKNKYQNNEFIGQIGRI